MNSAQPVPGSALETEPGRSSDPQQTSTNPAQPVPDSAPPEVDTNRSTRAQPELFTSALRAYPVLESLIQQSHRTDMQNLARTNSEVHAILTAGGVSPTSDSALWVSCPKTHGCFWCGMPLCQHCAHSMDVPTGEIREAILSLAWENLQSVLVCSDCLGKSWGDWVDTAGRFPNA